MGKRTALYILLAIAIFGGIFLFYIYLNNFEPAVEGKPTGAIRLPAALPDEAEITPEQKKIMQIEQATKLKVEQIVKEGTTETGGLTKTAQEKIEEAVNQEIREKLKLKTPAEIEADRQRKQDLQKIEDEVNKAIKEKLNN